ncbi:MAG: hypothetical protein K4571_16595 [Deltaproteobacteria bacterium]
MKRVWLFLLSLGLITAFCTSAIAVDVKFSGEFYAAGMYQDKTTLKKDTGSDGPSTAFYFQRLRLRTDFSISPGLTLTTRADIMERAWGAQRSIPGTIFDQQSAGTTAENENIAFDLAYVNYASPIGLFMAGYQLHAYWGTVFGNSAAPYPRLTYALPIGDFQLVLHYTKNNENSRTAKNITDASDRDSDQYVATINYNFKNGSVGLLATYLRQATMRAVVNPQTGFMTNGFALEPYIKAKLGPVSIQAELDYAWGQFQKWEGAFPFSVLPDTRLENIAAFLDATANFDTIYIGGTLAYVSGDDPGTGQKEGTTFLTGGLDWNPCLILFNSDRNYWAGNIPAYDTSGMGAPMSNAWFFQGRIGVRPIADLDVMASVAYANADKKPSVSWLYNSYGYEMDLTATYKITNNLSYMLGFGYLFTGNYFKGTKDSNQLNNDYLVINKLTLTF